MDKPSPDSVPMNVRADRRRRSRLRGSTPGWLLPDSGDMTDPWEIRIHDVSRHGVGFESSEKLQDGDIVRVRIGRGPLELAKRIRVVRCNPGQGGTFKIGGEFV
jgi:hypothetical protein